MQDVYDLFHDINRIWAHPRGEMCARSSGGTLSPSLWRCATAWPRWSVFQQINDGGKRTAGTPKLGGI